MMTKTMILAGLLAAGTAASVQAQTATAPTRNGAPVVTTTPGATLPPTPGTNTSTGTPAGAGFVDRNSGPAAAAGNRNQAVTTTSANAPQPAKGANSFSSGEARRRIERQGYSTVADLKKDNDGVWRGTGMKDGSKVGVWRDYKGNVGQQ